MQKSNNTFLYLGLGALVFGGIAMVATKKNTSAPPIDTGLDVDNSPNGVVATQPKPLNLKLLLKVGVTGAEVAELQRLLKVSIDGVFGSKETEPALFKLKGVKQTTLEQYPKLITLNQTRYPKDTKVMSNNKKGTPLYNALTKADGSYYSNYEIDKTIDYGDAVGKIRGSNQAGNWYTVYVDTFFGTKVFFVKAADIIKY